VTEINGVIARRTPGRIRANEAPTLEPLEPKQGRSRKPRLRTLGDLDKRTASAQQAHRLIANLEAELGGDLSTAQRELVKRAALIGAILEDAEVSWLQRRPADLAIYGMLVDRQRRCLEALGLKRQARDVTIKAMLKRVRAKAKANGGQYA
jgi:hypothetical protein